VEDGRTPCEPLGWCAQARYRGTLRSLLTPGTYLRRRRCSVLSTPKNKVVNTSARSRPPLKIGTFSVAIVASLKPEKAFAMPFDFTG
jgi:hypothetical protein